MSVGAAGACEADEPSGTSSPGTVTIVQPPGDGRRMAEAAACEALLDAEAAARQRLGCAPPSGACPERVRAASALCDAEYDQGSVEACVAFLGEHGACEHFEQKICVITVFPESGRSCLSTGTAGAGGAAGNAGTAGMAGAAPGQAGQGGVSGAGGEAAAAGSGGAAGQAGGAAAGAAGMGGAGGATEGTGARRPRDP